MALGAVQARINSAINARLRDDTIASPVTSGDSLEELFLAIGGTVSPQLALYWFRANPKAPLPYIVFGPEDRITDTEALRCGEGGMSEIRYIFMVVTEGIDSSVSIDIVDRLATLLDGFIVTVDSQRLRLLRGGDFCEPDYTTGERGCTRHGLVYRVVAT